MYDHLPPIHRPDGERPFQEDWWIYKKFGIKVPRWVFNRPAVYPPKVIWGSPRLNHNNALHWKNEDEGRFGARTAFIWPEWGPKPWQPRDYWYFAICYPSIFGITVPLPTFSITRKDGKALRIGVRWSEGIGERYYQLLGFGTKEIP